MNREHNIKTSSINITISTRNSTQLLLKFLMDILNWKRLWNEMAKGPIYKVSQYDI